MKNKNFISGYVILDAIKWTDEQREQFNQLSKQYFLVFDELKTIGTLKKRTLYYLAMRNSNLITDTINEETKEVTPGILTLFASRNPDILCIHNIDGSFLGQTKNIIPATYSEEGELITEEIVTYSGDALYPLKKDKYMPYLDNINTYDEEGKLLSSVKQTEPKPIRLFAGFKEPNFN